MTKFNKASILTHQHQFLWAQHPYIISIYIFQSPASSDLKFPNPQNYLKMKTFSCASTVSRSQCQHKSMKFSSTIDLSCHKPPSTLSFTNNQNHLEMKRWKWLSTTRGSSIQCIECQSHEFDHTWWLSINQEPCFAIMALSLRLPH